LEGIAYLHDQTCLADFEPLSDYRTTPPAVLVPPSGAVQFTLPEFVELSRQLADRQNINAGITNINNNTYYRAGVNIAWPVTFDHPFGSLQHFQLWKEGKPDTATHESPFVHSVEVQNGCTYLSYTDSLTPYWYDEFLAVDLKEGVNGPGTPVPEDSHLRSWTSDRRTFGDLKLQNNLLWFDYLVPDANHDANGNWFGPAFPPGRAPAPHWYNSCQGIPRPTDAFEIGLAQVAGDPGGLEPSGFYCGYVPSSIGNNNTEWSTLCSTNPYEPSAACDAYYSGLRFIDT
jgi:hypothetical protein